MVSSSEGVGEAAPYRGPQIMTAPEAAPEELLGGGMLGMLA